MRRTTNTNIPSHSKTGGLLKVLPGLLMTSASEIRNQGLVAVLPRTTTQRHGEDAITNYGLAGRQNDFPFGVAPQTASDASAQMYQVY